MTEESNDRNKLDLMRSLALGVSTAGALGSFALTLQAGAKNGPAILTVLFLVWVLSPFIVLIISCMLSKRWSFRTRISLYFLMLMISFATLLTYGRLLSFSGVRPAFVFLVIPFISWILILTTHAFPKR
jgi:hypothetical protein